jgi:hypothetical protein
MLLIILLVLIIADPVWSLVLLPVGMLLVLIAGFRLLLRLEARRERKRTEVTSRAWSTQRATIVVLSFLLLLYLFRVFM